MKYISFVCFSAVIMLVQGFITNMEKKAPLVISSESEKLKNIFSHKKSTILLVDYEMESYSMENIKLMYNHVHEFSLLLEYIREIKTCRIVNFKLNQNMSDSDQFHFETQVFNILRAFLSGMYSVDPMFFPKTWKQFEKLNRLNDNKEKKELFYFSDKKMYRGKLKRFDSFLLTFLIKLAIYKLGKLSKSYNLISSYHKSILFLVNAMTSLSYP